MFSFSWKLKRAAHIRTAGSVKQISSGFKGQCILQPCLVFFQIVNQCKGIATLTLDPWPLTHEENHLHVLTRCLLISNQWVHSFTSNDVFMKSGSWRGSNSMLHVSLGWTSRDVLLWIWAQSEAACLLLWLSMSASCSVPLTDSIRLPPDASHSSLSAERRYHLAGNVSTQKTSIAKN